MDVKNYIKLTKWLSGETIMEQVKYLYDNDMIDKNTRLFFSGNNMLCTNDIAELLNYFTATKDMDFDANNIIFVPKDIIINKRIAL